VNLVIISRDFLVVFSDSAVILLSGRFDSLPGCPAATVKVGIDFTQQPAIPYL
jgi:hypothetical protein